MSVTIPLEHGRSLMAMTSSQASTLPAQGSIGVLKRYGTLSVSLGVYHRLANGWTAGINGVLKSQDTLPLDVYHGLADGSTAGFNGVLKR